MHKIAEVLSDPTYASDLGQLVSRAGDILRFLTNVTEPMGKGETTPSLESCIQDRLVHALQEKLSIILKIMLGAAFQEQDGVPHQALVRLAIFLARLLQFDLGLSEVWTQDMKNRSQALSSTLFQLALVSGLR